MKMKEFVFGKGAIPEWFKSLCSTGRAKVVYDDEGEIVKAVLYAPGGVKEAFIGDTIIYVASGLAVIPAEKAKKYGLQRKDKVKNEAKAEEKPEAPVIEKVDSETDLDKEAPDGE